ncbi:MAG TPA: hypothetical protein VEZ51_11570 [Gemmatimonadaceae bacterium]|nr:hypothetical protein [Gemmatimonadaceae bacterium]
MKPSAASTSSLPNDVSRLNPLRIGLLPIVAVTCEAAFFAADESRADVE